MIPFALCNVDRAANEERQSEVQIKYYPIALAKQEDI